MNNGKSMGIIFLFFIGICTATVADTNNAIDDKVIKIVESNPKIIDFYGLFVNKKDSGAVMYFENNPRKDNTDNYIIYVGEKKFAEHRYIRFSTFYYYYKTRELYEQEPIDTSKKTAIYNKLIFSETSVDSIYPGYKSSPLNDGIVYTDNLFWNEAAWASSETETDHWVKIKFDVVENVNNIIIYWALDKGVYYKSRNIKIYYFDKNNQPIELIKVKKDDHYKDRTIITFNNISSSQILIKQVKNGGSKQRPNLMWIREICMY